MHNIFFSLSIHASHTCGCGPSPHVYHSFTLTPQRLFLSLFLSLSSISPCISLPLPVVQWMSCSLWLSLSLRIALSTYFSLFLSSYAHLSLSLSKKISFSHYKSTIVNKYYIFLIFFWLQIWGFESLDLLQKLDSTHK